MSVFTIQTESYEGPLETLLSLIEKRKLLINEVSLARVTDDYISYIESSPKESTLKNKTQFLVIASTLLLIKSRSLLPTLTLTKEETQDITELERRLKILQRIKETTPNIQEQFGVRMFREPKERKVVKSKEIVFTPAGNLTFASIQSAIIELTKILPKKEVVPEAVVKKVISLEESMQQLTKRVTQNIQMSFSSFSGYGKKDKVHVVVSFLAMLELVKQGMISVRQDTAFEDIDIETKELTTPHYS